MKIFLTGHAGFIGRHLEQRLLDRGEVVRYNRYQNIMDRLHISQPNIIINCAAEISDTSSMFRSNVDLTQQILLYCKQFPKTCFIHLGSSSEYGPHNQATAENCGLAPHSFYAATKAAASLLCQAWAKTWNLDVTVLRPYSPYGAGDRAHRLFSKLWRAFAYQEPMHLTQGVHDWIYISDMVDAVESVLQGARQPGDIFNVGSGQQISNLEVLQTWETITGVSAPVEILQEMSTPPVWCGDIGLIKQRHEWSPKVNLFQGIQLLVQQQSQIDAASPSWLR